MEEIHQISMFLVFLKVRTKLENPTRYHVIQKQKNQVRQYLSESLQTTGGIWGPTAAKHNNTNITSASSSLLNLQTASLNHNMHNIQHHQENQQSSLISQSIDYHSINIGINSDTAFSVEGNCEIMKGNLSNGSVPFFVQNNGRYVSPTESAMSPGMSSVATSASEVSQSIYKNFI
jgi:hypothetical protein